jgi:hypothetical protein
VPPPEVLDVAAILAAAYKRPALEIDGVAARVRARLALLETAGECARLLIEAPVSALSATLGGAAEEDVESGPSQPPATPNRPTT